MVIKRKLDIEEFTFSFCLFAEWDGKKFFLTMDDEINEGTITLMQYQEGNFTIHRMNKKYCDLVETPLEMNQLNKLIWHKRKYLNKLLALNGKSYGVK
jgi:hypothetical protein